MIITIVTGVLTVVYIVLVLGHIDLGAVAALPAGRCAARDRRLRVHADRLRPRLGERGRRLLALPAAATRAAAAWSAGRPSASSLAPVILLIFGILLAGSSTKLSNAIGVDPIGALASLLPTWFLVPFVIVAVLGLVGGAVLDIYSSGLALLSVGRAGPALRRGRDRRRDHDRSARSTSCSSRRTSSARSRGSSSRSACRSRPGAASSSPTSSLRRRDYAEAELYDRRGRYGAVRWLPISLVVVGTVIGWGLVTNTYAPWLSWQGYLLGPIGGGKRGRLGVREPRRAGRAGHRLPRHAALRPPRSAPGGRATDRRSHVPKASATERPAPGSLVVVDMQQVFGEPGEPLVHARASPRPPRGSTGCCPRSATARSFTRFVAPASSRRARGCRTTSSGRSRSCRRTTRSTTSCRSSATTGHPVVTATDVRQVGRRSSPGDRRQPTSWCSPASRPTAACCPRRSRRRTRACASGSSRTRARGSPTPTTSAPSTRWRCTRR